MSDEIVYTAGTREFKTKEEALEYAKTLQTKRQKTENELLDEVYQQIDPQRFSEKRIHEIVNVEIKENDMATTKKSREIDTPKIDTQEAIKIFCDNFKEFLLEKNRRYGDTACNRKAIFSKASSSDEGILIRLDDKISRIQNSSELKENDVEDTIGYLILLCINHGWLDPGKFLD
jgi:hypothetical protein